LRTLPRVSGLRRWVSREEPFTFNSFGSIALTGEERPVAVVYSY
jgi:hypothetical protein